LKQFYFWLRGEVSASWIGAERLSEKEKPPVKGEYPGEGRYWSQWLVFEDMNSSICEPERSS